MIQYTLLIALTLCPLGFAASPSGVLVVNTKGDSVSLVNLRTNETVSTLRVGKSPYAVSVNVDESTFVVGVEGEEKLKFYSLKTLKQIGEYHLGPMHHDHFVLSKNKQDVLVANFYSDSMVAVNLNTFKESYRIRGLSAPHVVKYGPKGTHAYLTLKKVTGIGRVSPQRGGKKTVFPLKVNPRSLTFSPDEKFAYFGSFWVDGFFELDLQAGKVTRLITLPTPKEDSLPKEVTYHGVEFVGKKHLVAANEGRSYLDLVDTSTGALSYRLTTVSNPCCIETINSTKSESILLISNLGDNTVEKVLVKNNRLQSIAKIKVGQSPKRVAFLYSKIAKDYPRKVN